MGPKTFSVAVINGYDSDGKLIDFKYQSRLKAVKYSAVALKVSFSENLATKFSAYHSATLCPTYKKAKELAEFWNKAFKENGTFAT